MSDLWPRNRVDPLIRPFNEPFSMENCSVTANIRCDCLTVIIVFSVSVQYTFITKSFSKNCITSPDHSIRIHNFVRSYILPNNCMQLYEHALKTEVARVLTKFHSDLPMQCNDVFHHLRSLHSNVVYRNVVILNFAGTLHCNAKREVSTNCTFSFSIIFGPFHCY